MTVMDASLSTPAHERIEQQAARRPEAVALLMEPTRLNYGALNERANRLAHYLRAQGVGAESVVGVCMARSPQMVVALLAILKAGGAYLPLDPDHPAERKAFMLDDAHAALLLTESALLPSLAGYDGATLCLDQAETLLASYPTTNLAVPLMPETLAYVIYTSGSTGRPKGVQISHRALTHLCQWQQEIYHLSSTDRATLLAGQAFDASVLELWPSLTAGASVAIPPEQVRLSPADLIAWLREWQVTVCFLPTPLAEAVLERLSAEPIHGLSLRVLLTGGDRLHRRPSAGLGFDFVNLYGPTENTVVATYGTVAPGAGGAPPSIGRAVDEVELHVLDARMAPVPQGAAGELYIGGVQLARGYLGRPTLTAQAFVPHPFSDVAGARLYKTGDLVRWLPDGTLDFLGRADHQVKIRGFRIELGEIEARLHEHPDIESCLVLLREDTPGDKRLVGYFIPRPERIPSPEELYQFLQARMPEYMVPAAFVSLTAFPLTSNGKVERRELPQPERQHLSLTVPYQPPVTETQKQLVTIWAEIMQLEQVGIHDNFLHLGGHSLLATQIVSRIRQVLEVDLPPGALFTTPTIARLAEAIEALPERAQPPQPTPLLRAVSRDAYRVKR